MKAIVVRAAGGPEVLQIEDAPRPALGPGQVLVRVHAAGINFSETRRRGGRYGPAGPYPFIPGGEACGVVEEVAADVTSVRQGARVIATTPGGSYAEYAVAAADSLILMPDSMDFVQGAAFRVTALTAYQILVTMAHLEPGESVLVHSAAGGVGSVAVQLARALGAGTIIATASSPAKLELARTLGAAAGVDYTAGPWAEQVLALTEGRGADVILDAVGGPVFEESLKALASFGRLVLYGSASGVDTSFEPRQIMPKNQTVMGFSTAPMRLRPEAHLRAVKEMLNLVASGQV
ncbi:MAG: NADPH:quinone oxidoreductase family protein, partial [Chloroflexi bacterium]|nr:NADPH:quinone oxidoreductase family protein [Chloroflexota bacterium]